MTEANTEVAARADFSRIRYAQCWEDADVLVAGLGVRPGGTYVSIASAGDNSLALLAAGAGAVHAVDLNPAQLHCLALRVAAFRVLDHQGLLELMGSVPSTRRLELYGRCRKALPAEARRFWDGHREGIAAGIGGLGKFEHYFRIFRRWVLPLVHNRRKVEALLTPRDISGRRAFYDGTWDTWRWRAMFSVFFSRLVMGRMGRDPAFFRYVEGNVAERILERTRYALTELDPADNPYLQWILTGRHGCALPFALRPENFDAVRGRLDRITWRRASLENLLDDLGPRSVDGFNLSDIFEYMSPAAAATLLQRIVSRARAGARLVYWNMLVPRRRPEDMAGVLVPRGDLAARLFAQDKAFFYSALVIEEVRA